jgi:hypothetical protein
MKKIFYIVQIFFMYGVGESDKNNYSALLFMQEANKRCIYNSPFS